MWVGKKELQRTERTGYPEEKQHALTYDTSPASSKPSYITCTMYVTNIKFNWQKRKKMEELVLEHNLANTGKLYCFPR